MLKQVRGGLLEPRLVVNRSSYQLMGCVNRVSGLSLVVSRQVPTSLNILTVGSNWPLCWQSQQRGRGSGGGDFAVGTDEEVFSTAARTAALEDLDVSNVEIHVQLFFLPLSLSHSFLGGLALACRTGLCPFEGTRALRKTLSLSIHHFLLSAQPQPSSCPRCPPGEDTRCACTFLRHLSRPVFSGAHGLLVLGAFCAIPVSCPCPEAFWMGPLLRSLEHAGSTHWALSREQEQAGMNESGFLSLWETDSCLSE